MTSRTLLKTSKAPVRTTPKTAVRTTPTPTALPRATPKIAARTTPKAPTRATIAELAAELRPSLLRLTRIVRNQRVDISITLTQLSAMATLHKRGPMSAGELASCERVQPPSMTKVLSDLEERGLVRRAAHPGDRRQAIIAITDAGIGLLDSERRSRDAWLSQRLAQLTPDERALLRAVVPLLDKLAAL